VEFLLLTNFSRKKPGWVWPKNERAEPGQISEANALCTGLVEIADWQRTEIIDPCTSTRYRCVTTAFSHSMGAGQTD